MQRGLGIVVACALVVGGIADARAQVAPAAPAAPGAPAAAPNAGNGARAPTPPAPPAPPPRGRDRMLGGHRFIPFRTVPFPFVAFRFGSDTALGGARVNIEDPALAAMGLDPRASFRSFEQTLRAGIRILPWLGAEAQVRGALALGTDDTGALVLGSTYEYGASLGALATFVETRVVVLSARLDVRLARVEGILPGALLDSVEVIDGEPVYDVGALTFDAFAARFAPTLGGAFALTRVLGAQLGGGIEVARLGTDQGHDWEERVFGAAGLSIGAGPVSFLFGGRIDHDLDRDASRDVLLVMEPVDGTRGEIEGAVYYTGRPELDLGLGVTHLVAGEDRRTLGVVTVAYWW